MTSPLSKDERSSPLLAHVSASSTTNEHDATTHTTTATLPISTSQNEEVAFNPVPSGTAVNDHDDPGQSTIHAATTAALSPTAAAEVVAVTPIVSNRDKVTMRRRIESAPSLPSKDDDVDVKPPTNDLKQQMISRLTKRRRNPKQPNDDNNGDGIFRNEGDGDDEHGIALTNLNNYDYGTNDDDGDSATTDTWSLEDEDTTNNGVGAKSFTSKIASALHLQQNHHHPTTAAATAGQNNGGLISMSAADIAVCQQLDAEYERALEERDVTYTARYQSVRQSTCLSIVFMGLFMMLGTIFFERQAPNWGLQESLLFTIYTITTVGYGHLETPDTPAFQLYTIFFIFIGIAILTIMIAQVYQCIALEASRAATSTDSKSSMRVLLAAHIDRAKQQQQLHHNNQHPLQLVAGIQRRDTTTTSQDTADGYNIMENQYSSSAAAVALHPNDYDPHMVDDYWPHFIERVLHYWDTMMTFFRENEVGRSLAVLLPFVGLILVGALIIGPLEGWTFLESVYFAVVSLTTVGFGDYYPTRPASIWFCIMWLPFSIGFMSLYFTNVAAFYLRLSDKNIERIESNLRREIERRKEVAEKERLRVLERAMRGQGHDAVIRHRSSSKDYMENDLVLRDESSSMNAGSGGDNAGGGDTNNNLRSDHHVNNNNTKFGSTTGRNRRRGFETLPMNDESNDGGSGNNSAGTRERTHMFSSAASNNKKNRREQVLHNSQHLQQQTRAAQQQQGDALSSTSTNPLLVTRMVTMKDVLRAIHQSNAGSSIIARSLSSEDDSSHVGGVASGGGNTPLFHTGPESEYLSVRSSSTMKDSLHGARSKSVMKPSFALRALVQERFAEIIATDIAGYQSYVEIKDYTLSVTINTLKQTADKWLVPRRARRAFRAVAFEALYFVGEHGLITRGADALFALTPFEFHQIFSPLLAAFGDAETMEQWLIHTDILADVDLRGTNIVDLDPLMKQTTTPLRSSANNSLSGQSLHNDDDENNII